MAQTKNRIPSPSAQKEFYDPRYYTISILPEQSIWLVNSELDKFRREYSVNHSPINSFKLAQKIVEAGKIKLTVIPVDGLSDKLDAVAEYLPQIEEYLIHVNKRRARSLKNSRDRRCNFTMAHEIAHIVLGHLLIPREVKSKRRIAIEEEEANLFAGKLLLPEHLLLKSNFYSQAAVADSFLVSYSCVWMRLNNLKRLDVLQSKPRPACVVCGNANISPVAEYCVICGTLFLDKHKKGIKVVEYFAIQTDVNQRMISCPVCDNTEFSKAAEYCRICGQPLFNRCDGNGGFVGCGHPNPPNARHCELCGVKTKYSLLGRFRAWADERAEYIAATAQR